MIRAAVMSDLLAVERMVLAFADAAEQPLPRERYARAHLGAVLAALIDSRDGYAAVLDLGGAVRGVLLARVSLATLAPVRVADEIAWWIDPPARGGWGVAMLACYEAWAREAGAEVIGLTTLDDRAASLYERAGFRRAELRYAKAG